MDVNEAKKIVRLEDALEFCKEQAVLEQYVSDEKWKYLSIAADAIKKQIPKKPISYDKHYFICPGCREDLGKDEDAIYVYQEIPPDFCEKCGQALDWSDT